MCSLARRLSVLLGRLLLLTASGPAACCSPLQVQHSVLFTGTSGVGKSAVVLDTLMRLADAQYGETEDHAKPEGSVVASTGAWVPPVCLCARSA